VAIGVLLALSYRELIAFAAIALAGWVSFRNSGLWVLIAISLLPLWSLLFGEPLTITWFCLGLLGLVVVKRLLANWTPLPEGIPKGKVLLYRLLYDRDVQKREEWIYRVPGEE
jgi:predicted membrane protein